MTHASHKLPAVALARALGPAGATGTRGAALVSTAEH